MPFPVHFIQSKLSQLIRYSRRGSIVDALRPLRLAFHGPLSPIAFIKCPSARTVFYARFKITVLISFYYLKLICNINIILFCIFFNFPKIIPTQRILTTRWSVKIQTLMEVRERANGNPSGNGKPSRKLKVDYETWVKNDKGQLVRFETFTMSPSKNHHLRPIYVQFVPFQWVFDPGNPTRFGQLHYPFCAGHLKQMLMTKLVFRDRLNIYLQDEYTDGWMDVAWRPDALRISSIVLLFVKILFGYFVYISFWVSTLLIIVGRCNFFLL